MVNEIHIPGVLKVKWEVTWPFQVECLPAARIIRTSLNLREVEYVSKL